MSYQRIRDALEPLGIPVTSHSSPAGAPVYAVVTEMLEQPEQCADGRETLTGYYAQIDFISKTNLEEIVRTATRLLTAAGFMRRGKYTEYVPEAKVFRASLRIKVLTSYEEEI